MICEVDLQFDNLLLSHEIVDLIYIDTEFGLYFTWN